MLIGYQARAYPNVYTRPKHCYFISIGLNKNYFVRSLLILAGAAGRERRASGPAVARVRHDGWVCGDVGDGPDEGLAGESLL